ncbi:MAG: SLBB domain-containing protein [Blastocatellia bacterium]|nr:SLBB domain-containing protein [Blastocatellia bacterium]
MKYVVLLLSLAISAITVPGQTTGDKVVDTGYMIGPGDEITAKVLGEPQFDFVATVDEDGKIEVPFTDQLIVAQCRTERELRTEVSGFLSKYLRNPQLSLRVTDRKSRPPATIYGEVKTPAQIELRRRTTLVELISFSGGITDDAGGMVQVFRTRPPLCSKVGDDGQWATNSGDPTDVPSRMYSLASIRSGKEEANPIIYPGDVIVVQKAAPVYVTGEVVAPQGIYLKEGGMSLSEAIAKIGGVRAEAKTKDIKIYRLKSNSKDREIIAANLDLIKKGEQKDPTLEPYDIIEVNRAKDSIGETILKLVTGAGRTAFSSMTSGVGTRILY